jgi:hypothetical protein
MLNVIDDTVNPVEPFLRTDRMPHMWCPGCGIGTTVNSFARALIDSKIDLQSLALVSGIGCTGRVAGYVKLDSFHTTHGRACHFRRAGIVSVRDPPRHHGDHVTGGLQPVRWRAKAWRLGDH